MTTAFDILGRVSSLTDYDGTATRYDRDAEGKVIKTYHPDGSTTEYDYNSAGLLTLQKEVTASNVTRRQIAYTYDDVGNLTSANRSGVDIDKKIVGDCYPDLMRLSISHQRPQKRLFSPSNYLDRFDVEQGEYIDVLMTLLGTSSRRSPQTAAPYTYNA